MRTPTLLLIVGWFAAAGVGHAAPGSRADTLLAALYDPADPTVFVVAHRGDWRNFPENSLPAIRSAIAMGAHVLELDIRATADGELVVIHDKTLDRTTTGTGPIAHRTLAELRTFRLRNGYGAPTDEVIPTLEDALRAVGDDALVYLDKSYAHIREAHAVAARLGVADRVFFYGHVTATRLAADYPDLADTLPYLPKLDPDHAEPDAYLAGFLTRRHSPVVVVSFDREDAGFLARLDAVRAAGRRVWMSPLWPSMCAGRTDDGAVHDPDAHWGWLLERGASMICTDRPALLLEYLNARRTAAPRART